MMSALDDDSASGEVKGLSKNPNEFFIRPIVDGGSRDDDRKALAIESKDPRFLGKWLGTNREASWRIW